MHSAILSFAALLIFLIRRQTRSLRNRMNGSSSDRCRQQFSLLILFAESFCKNLWQDHNVQTNLSTEYLSSIKCAAAQDVENDNKRNQTHKYLHFVQAITWLPIRDFFLLRNLSFCDDYFALLNVAIVWAIEGKSYLLMCGSDKMALGWTKISWVPKMTSRFCDFDGE